MIKKSVMAFYLMRCYGTNFLIFLMGLLSIIYLFDTIEILRQAAKVGNVPLPTVLVMGLYKLPEVGQMVFPFVVLFSGMMTFWQLNKRHEITILKAAGFSVWQFLLPVIVVACVIGCFKITVINPVGASFVAKFEDMESQFLEYDKNVIQLSNQGLWLRQDYSDGRAILHAKKIKFPDWRLQSVMVMFFDQDRTLVRRIDAKQAKLAAGEWIFEEAHSYIPGSSSQKIDYLSLATDLTIDDLKESFAVPETISFWRLPNYIQVLETTGFDATNVKIYFQKLLSDPLLYIAMILLAASVSLRPMRSGNKIFLILAGIAFGFVVFFGSSYLQALGASGQIPIVVSAWLPPFMALVTGVTIILFLEDG